MILYRYEDGSFRRIIVDVLPKNTLSGEKYPYNFIASLYILNILKIVLQ